MVGELKITKMSKPIKELKNNDFIFINDKKMIIDSHYLFIAHKDTNEMIIEFFNPENNREYQLRYFDDQVETSIEIYELQEEFQYVKREPKTISW
ncbi:MAG: hypothetical protein PHX15_01285 [Candidatus Nanoarchaeia archaeon]|jgi:hypothetical protein|nr:hypothetical protein [Candidatus Nanoarchaeia archaeon]MDD3993815.1 hypothetical protein [Candidatus Nanoarchaeia archaeon]MDD4563263.1 hypothetical protein [Candidatus Nanoarchaeia archaeon]